MAQLPLLLVGICVTAFAQSLAFRVQRVSFNRDGNRYTVVRREENGGHGILTDIPKQGDTDRAVVLHIPHKNITVYKDITVGACFLATYVPQIQKSLGLIIRYGKADDRLRNFDYSIFPFGPQIQDLGETGGQRAAQLCEGFPTWRAWILKRDPSADDSETGTVSRRQKRWSWSSSSAIAINRDGSIERCFKTDHGESAATNCTAGGASASGEANSTSSNLESGEQVEETGVWRFIKSLFGRNKRSLRQKRWSFSSSAAVSVGSDGKIQRCLQTNSGQNSSASCETSGASASGSATSGNKNATGNGGKSGGEGQSFWDWLFGRN